MSPTSTQGRGEDGVKSLPFRNRCLVEDDRCFLSRRCLDKFSAGASYAKVFSLETGLAI